MHLREGGEGLDFLGFHHRPRAHEGPASAHHFLARWPSREAMGRPRERIHEITDRKRLRLPVEWIVQDLDRFLRGWGGYFRYGHSAHHFDQISHYAVERLALFVSKPHNRARGYGPLVVVAWSPNRLGLMSLQGTVVSPRGQQALAGKAECHR